MDSRKDAGADALPNSTSARSDKDEPASGEPTGDNAMMPRDEQPPIPQTPTDDSVATPFDDLPAARRLALESGLKCMRRHQSGSGMWQGHSGLSVSCTARLVLLLYWMDQGDAPSVQQAVDTLMACSLPAGGWSESGRTDEGAALDLDASVMAYLALRVHGIEGRTHSSADTAVDAARPMLEKARQAICVAGGLDGCDAVSRYWMALFGILSYTDCPAVAAESFRWPIHFVDSAHRQGHWIRAIQAPLALLHATRPVKVLKKSVTFFELVAEGHSHRLARLARGGLVPTHPAGPLGTVLRWLEIINVRPFRHSSLAMAQTWITENISSDDGLAGNWNATLLAAIALISRGVSRQSQSIVDLLQALKQGMTRYPEEPTRPGRREPGVSNEDATAHGAAPPPTGQPGENQDGGPAAGLTSFRAPTIDTAIAIRAITSVSRTQESPEVRTAVEWLLSREAINTSVAPSEHGTDPSGWCREISNQQFASVPTTAMVLLAFREQFIENPPSSLVTDDSMVAMIRANSLNLAHRRIAVLDRVAAASRRSRRWLLSLQNADGGWGHSQRAARGGRLRTMAEWQRLQDQSTAAATGRVLQALGAWETACGQTSVDGAITWLRRTQRKSGAWAGQFDASDLEATCAVISGMRAVGVPRRDQAICAAANWCLKQQNPDGGWSDRPGPADASEPDANVITNQPSDILSTAWALLALVAAGHREEQPAQTGLAWLIQQQQPNGNWHADAPFGEHVEQSRATRSRRVRELSFRTTVTTNAYAILAISAFRPMADSRPSANHASLSRRLGQI